MNYPNCKILLLWALVLCTGLGPNCVSRLAGGTEDVNTKTVVGKIYTTKSLPANNTHVQLIPAGYDPVHDTSLSADFSTTTGPDGEYSFKISDSGIYNVYAIDPVDHTRLLKTGVHIIEKTTNVGSDSLKQPSTIKIFLSGGLDTMLGYVFFPGTILAHQLSGKSGAIEIDSVPCGIVPPINYKVNSIAAPIVLSDSILVRPVDSMATVFIGWKFSKILRLNTTSSGAGISGNVIDFPILVRLNSGNFNFSEAQSGGSDLRFYKPDNTALPYEIEHWDTATRQAEIWVSVDTVYGNNNSQNILMYWGNPSATSASNGATAFDTTNGFQGVWHLGEASGSAAKDATINHFVGTPSIPAPAAAAGMIGTGKHFDGVSQSFDMIGTGASKLTFAENGHYSLSAGWEFTEFHARSGWEIAYYVPPVARSWKYLVGVRNGSSQYLYLDGQLVFTTNGYTPGDTLPRDTTSDVSIGRYLSYVTELKQGFAFFDGLIDEVRISNVSRSADWIRLEYMNQKADGDALVVFK